MIGEEAKRRVVVTGRGALLPWGEGPAAMPRLREPAPAEPPGAVRFAAREFVPNAKVLRAMHRGFQLTAAAAVLAMREAGLADAAGLAAAGVDPRRAGTVVAAGEINPATADLVATVEAHALTTAAEWGAFGQAALHGLHPFRRLALLTNMAAAHVSILFGLQGPSLTLTSGAAAGAQILREGYWAIAEGRANLMVCEASDTPQQAVEAEATGEAAAAIVLESLETAQAREVEIWAEVGADIGEGGAGLGAGWERYFPNCGPLMAALAGVSGGPGARLGMAPSEVVGR